jgi:hypothetical protein
VAIRLARLTPEKIVNDKYKAKPESRKTSFVTASFVREHLARRAVDVNDGGWESVPPL